MANFLGLFRRKKMGKRVPVILLTDVSAEMSEYDRIAVFAAINDSIEPVPLVSPAVCPPPEELKSKHFNDRALLYSAE